MSDPQIQPAPMAMRWDTLGTGADLWATVVMAVGFVLPAGQAVREHYRITRTLGQGGMGQVLGVMLVGSPDQQMFALKMVARPASVSNDPADQAEAEMQAKAFAALLRGEAAKQELVQRHGVAVARLFALVRFEDGSLGLRMEIARGQSLENFLDNEMKERANETPDLDWSLVVMRKVLYQLRRLHELVDPSSPAGFVHSDMKPGNVFVDDGDRYDPFVTLLDFGVATAGHALNVDQGSRAQGRKSLILHDAGGTFGFAPPHHFTGKPSPLSDVYAALVILYELIALQSPWDFTGISKTAGNLFKLEDAMRKGPRPVRTGRAAISVDTAATIDAFFRDEFGALQQLADEAHDARNAVDEGRRREMAERLRKLAQGYQGKLDVLRQQLTGVAAGATRTSDPLGRDTPLSRARTEAGPTPLPREAETRIDTKSRRVAADAANTSTPAVVTDSRDDEPVRVPMKPLVGWKSALVLLAFGAAGAWVYLHGVPPQVRQMFGNESVPVIADSGVDAAVPVVDAGNVALLPDVAPVPAVAVVDAAPLNAVDAALAATTLLDAAATSDVTVAIPAQTMDASMHDAIAAVDAVLVAAQAPTMDASTTLVDAGEHLDASVPEPNRAFAHDAGAAAPVSAHTTSGTTVPTHPTTTTATTTRRPTTTTRATTTRATTNSRTQTHTTQRRTTTTRPTTRRTTHSTTRRPTTTRTPQRRR